MEDYRDPYQQGQGGYPPQGNYPPPYPPDYDPEYDPEYDEEPENDNSKMVKVMLIITAAVVTVGAMVMIGFFALNSQIEEPPVIVTTAATEPPVTQPKLVMPDLKGMSREDGVRTLTAMELSVEVIETETDKQKDGFVFNQAPVKNVELKPGDTVTLYIARAHPTEPETEEPEPEPETKATTPSTTVAPTTQTEILYCVATDYVTLRSGAGATYAELTKIPTGASMVKLGTSGAWYYVRYNGQTGYVSAPYVSTEPYVPTTAATQPTTKAASNPSSSTLRVTASDFVSLREGPGTSYKELTKIYNGGTMTFLANGSTAGWYYVQYGTQRGYVSANYVEFV